MKIEFTKMHGIGNDYIYIDCFKNTVTYPEKLSVIMSDRHFGVGGDGIVLILPSDTSNAQMRMFNADGSEGKMCGNAIRCIGKFLFDNGYVNSNVITIETLSGIKTLELIVENQKCIGASVDMGYAQFGLLDHLNNIVFTQVSMGNPHAVVFSENIDTLDIEPIALNLQNSELFPESVNVGFCEIHSDFIKLRVYERGSGETLACGTGACAAVAACVKNGFFPFNKDIPVNLKGGILTISCSEQFKMKMTGPATKVFCGTFEY